MATARRKITHESHLAILDSYLPPQRAPRVTKGKPSGGLKLGGARAATARAQEPPPADKGRLLHTLVRNKAHIPAPLLGIAVWNLLPHYTSPPGPMRDLLREIFDLDFIKAQRLRRQTLADAFPPYPDRFILDSDWQPERRTDGASNATLEICVPRRFDEMRDIVNPAHWSGNAFFWGSLPKLTLPTVEQQRPGTAAPPPVPRKFEAQLTLPLAAAPQPLQVTIEAHVIIDPFTTQLHYTLYHTAQIARCKGAFIVSKQESRPGATRIIMQRLLQLGTKDLTRQNAILRYWLHSDAVCLALSARAG